MNIETVGNKIDNLDYTLKELVNAINQTNKATITSVLVILTAMAIAIIISNVFFIKYLKKLQKQVMEQGDEIKKLKEEGHQK